MKIVKTISLKKGDWIVDKPKNFKSKQGKFAIGRVKEFKVIFDKAIFIINKNLKEEKDCSITFEDSEDLITKLNKKDLKEFKQIETKMKMLNELKMKRI